MTQNHYGPANNAPLLINHATLFAGYAEEEAAGHTWQLVGESTVARLW